MSAVHIRREKNRYLCRSGPTNKSTRNLLPLGSIVLDVGLRKDVELDLLCDGGEGSHFADGGTWEDL